MSLESFPHTHASARQPPINSHVPVSSDNAERQSLDRRQGSVSLVVAVVIITISQKQITPRLSSNFLFSAENPKPFIPLTPSSDVIDLFGLRLFPSQGVWTVIWLQVGQDWYAVEMWLLGSVLKVWTRLHLPIGCRGPGVWAAGWIVLKYM